MLRFYHTYVTRSELEDRLEDLTNQLNERLALMATQQDVDALVTQVAQVATDLDTAKTSLQAEIDSLSKANPALDLTGLQSAVAPLDAAAQALGALKPTGA